MTQSLSTKHPHYSLVDQDWSLMRDAYKGERRVKLQSTTYLPYTSGHIIDGAGVNMESLGQKAYEAYKMRARFPNFMREAIQMAIGMMHSQPPKIKLPKAMEGIRSSKGETMEVLLRRINVEQLITGRLGVMADITTDAAPENDLPYITTYTAERIVNWDDGRIEQLVPQALNMVVLNESEFERSESFSWTKESKYRVLVMGEVEENENKGTYRAGVFNENDYNEAGLKALHWKGRFLDRIPFVIINSVDLTSDVDDPPLLDLGSLCMTIYRADADYRQNLFLQGQDTFVTIGMNVEPDESVRTGAGSRIDLPIGGDAKYVGVQSTGLAEQRQALEKLESRAGSMGAQTLDSTSRERESGDSLRIRVAARTADMNQIVENGASGLESILKTVAVWVGENPDEVSVTPNKEFGEQQLTGQTMVEMATAATLGFPLSRQTMHDLARKRRMTEFTFEEEVEIAKKEAEDESFPFKKPETPDMAGADQNSEGDDTDGDQSARNKAKDLNDAGAK